MDITNFCIFRTGSVNLPVSYGMKHLPSLPFTVALHRVNMLGLDLFIDLGFSLTYNNGQAIMRVLPTTLQMQSAPFDGLGYLMAFIHPPPMDPKLTPVIQPLRQLPLALRDGVAAKLSVHRPGWDPRDRGVPG